MKTCKRILMAVKNPDAGRQPGIAKAISLAHRLGAALELYHAISAPVVIELERVTRKSVLALREEARTLRARQLERYVAAAGKRGVDACCTVEWGYPPHEAIVRRAARTRADLIAAEWHAGPRSRPWLVHLTDWELLRQSKAPVLLMRNTRPYRRPVVLAAVDPSHANAKPARLDADIVDTAARLSVALQGTMHVMHAIDSFSAGIMTSDATDVATVLLVEQALRDKGRRDFEALTTALGIDPARRHVVSGEAVKAIPRLARRLGAQIVVMGAVSRSGLGGVFIGNTAERVLGALPCDVLALRPAAGGRA